MSIRYAKQPPKSYQLAKRARQATNKRWSAEERRIVEDGVRAALSLDEIHAKLPDRTKKAVMLIVYEVRGPQDRDLSASLTDAKREKDAAEGSARLLLAMITAFPEMFELRLRA